MFQPVLISAQIGALFVDGLQGGVNSTNGAIRVFGGFQRDDGTAAGIANTQPFGGHGTNVHLYPLIHVGADVEPYGGSGDILAV